MFIFSLPLYLYVCMYLNSCVCTRNVFISKIINKIPTYKNMNLINTLLETHTSRHALSQAGLIFHVGNAVKIIR